MTKGLGKKVHEAIDFLTDHPAIAPHEFSRAIYFSINDVCKRGYDKIVDKMGIDVWPHSKGAEKFKAEFDKEYKELEESCKKYPEDRKMYDITKRFTKISVPYKKLYGEPWKYARTEYWGEVSFFIYHGNSEYKQWIKDQNPYTWQSYSAHIDVSAPSFEDMVIRLSKKFKERFGDFKADDFLTEAEKRNHKKEEIFFFKNLLRSSNKRLDQNPKYIHVSPATLNHRWATQWFLKTPYGKKTWDGKELRDILKK